jgi:hypothetical protein
MDNCVSMSYGEWCRREVRVGNRVMKLEPQEHKLVVALLRRDPEHFISSPNLMEEMWGYSIIPDQWQKVIHSHSHQLRDRGVPIESRPGRATGGIRICRRGRIALGDRVSWTHNT